MYERLRCIIEESNTLKKNLKSGLRLFIYGSVINGLFEMPPSSADGNNATFSSDLDLTLIMKEDKKMTQKQILKQIYSKLSNEKRLSSNSDFTFLHISDPYQMSAGGLLELKVRKQLPSGAKIEIDVDILLNKLLEIRNSELVCQYCLVDERYRKVALVLKAWNRKLSSDKNKRLNSFSIYMLLLAFMLHEKYMVNLQAHAPVRLPIMWPVLQDN